MLRWAILAVAVVFLTAAATLVPQYLPDPEASSKASVSVPTGPQPKVELDQEPIYDFGKMSQFDKGMHTWRIKNTGEADLELWMEGKPTCSCTIAKLENNQKATVLPGKSTTIDLEWNTKDLATDYSQGATFGTNDPLRPTFHLTVKGKVHPPVVVYPPEMVQFTTISNEETHHRAIAVYSQDRPDLKVTKVTSSKPDLIVATVKPLTPEMAKPLKVEAGYEILIEIKPGMPQGQFLEELVIRTDHPKRPEVRVSVGGKVIGPISIFPIGLRLRDVTSGEGASRVLNLMVRGGKETHFQVASKPENLEVDIVPDDRPGMKGHYLVTVKVPTGTVAGPIEGEIVLKTDHPLVSEVKIPVDILVSRSGSG
jgi:hypothetical protein